MDDPAGQEHCGEVNPPNKNRMNIRNRKAVAASAVRRHSADSQSYGMSQNAGHARKSPAGHLPEATPRPPRSHPQATLRPHGSQPVGTPKPPRSHPEATLRLPSSYPQATLRLPRGYLEAPLGDKVHPEAQNRAEQGQSMKAASGRGGDGLVPVIKPDVAANRGRGRPRPFHELALMAESPASCVFTISSAYLSSTKMWVMTRIEDLRYANRWCSQALSLSCSPHPNHPRIESI